jgi:hypothetical protein
MAIGHESLLTGKLVLEGPSQNEQIGSWRGGGSITGDPITIK